VRSAPPRPGRGGRRVAVIAALPRPVHQPTPVASWLASARPARIMSREPRQRRALGPPVSSTRAANRRANGTRRSGLRPRSIASRSCWSSGSAANARSMRSTSLSVSNVLQPSPRPSALSLIADHHAGRERLSVFGQRCVRIPADERHRPVSPTRPVIARAAVLLAAAATLAAVAAPHPAHGGGPGASAGRSRSSATRAPTSSPSRRAEPASRTCAGSRRRITLGARIRGVETTTYRVMATLIAMKRQEDSDIHLVIADRRDRRKTMIVEFPAPYCARSRAGGSCEDDLRAAGDPERLRQRKHFRVHLAARHGDDRRRRLLRLQHGQRGVAPNAIELHPVVRFSTDSCGLGAS
jgi:hypothetical protein